jgi:hypothetical protein
MVTHTVAFLMQNPAAEASSLIETLFSMYESMFTDVPGSSRGHLLQISIPHAALNDFVFPTLDWGRPVQVYEGEMPFLEVFPMFVSPSLPHLRAVPLDKILRSPGLEALQSRIIGHPNLFLQRGATAQVFHGSPSFDADRFRTARSTVLMPYVRKAKAMGKVLQFSKFLCRPVSLGTAP